MALSCATPPVRARALIGPTLLEGERERRGVRGKVAAGGCRVDNSNLREIQVAASAGDACLWWDDHDRVEASGVRVAGGRAKAAARRERAQAHDEVAQFCSQYPATRVEPTEDEVERLWARCMSFPCEDVADAFTEQLTWSNGNLDWQPRVRATRALQSFLGKGKAAQRVVALVLEDEGEALVRHLLSITPAASAAFQLLSAARRTRFNNSSAAVRSNIRLPMTGALTDYLWRDTADAPVQPGRSSTPPAEDLDAAAAAATAALAPREDPEAPAPVPRLPKPQGPLTSVGGLGGGAPHLPVAPRALRIDAPRDAARPQQAAAESEACPPKSWAYQWLEQAAAEALGTSVQDPLASIGDLTRHMSCVEGQGL